jgi:outer membrane protein W
MRTRGLAVVGLVVLLSTCLGFPTWAESGEMKIRFGVLYSAPTSDLKVGDETIEAQPATGFQASFEYRFSDLLGIEPALTLASHSVDSMESGFPDVEIGEADLTTLTANLNFHLLGESKLDLFVGPTIGYTFWGDLESDLVSDSFPVKDDFIYGVNVGIDVPFGESHWGFSGVLNWLQIDADLEDADPGDSALGVDPLQIKVGVYYRF